MNIISKPIMKVFLTWFLGKNIKWKSINSHFTSTSVFYWTISIKGSHKSQLCRYKQSLNLNSLFASLQIYNISFLPWYCFSERHFKFTECCFSVRVSLYADIIGVFMIYLYQEHKTFTSQLNLDLYSNDEYTPMRKL